MSEKGKNAIIVFSGFNQRAVIAFCRVVSRNSIPIFIIAKSNEDTILLSEYSKFVAGIRNSISLDFDDIKLHIEKIVDNNDYDNYILLPSSEALNRFFLDYRDEFYKLKCIIPLVDKYKYYTISDKYSFGRLCYENGIDIPREIIQLDCIEYPYVMKPKKYLSKDGKALYPQIIQNNKDKADFDMNYNINDFYAQEYIGGDSYYLLYYFRKDGNYLSFSQKNLMQQGNGKSIIAAVPADIHNEDISKKFITLFKKIGFYGLIMIEVKYYNDKFYMIEANPRLWGPSQLFVDCNIRLFEAFLEDNGFVCNYNKSKSLNQCYFWVGGMLESLNLYKEVVFHNYSHEEFFRDFSRFIKNEVYLRPDTEKIGLSEISHN